MALNPEFRGEYLVRSHAQMKLTHCNRIKCGIHQLGDEEARLRQTTPSHVTRLASYIEPLSTLFISTNTGQN